jgi:G3E family GTPase
VHVADGAVEPTAIFDIGLYDPATKSADVQRWLHDEAYSAGHAHTDQLDHVHGDGTDHAHGHGPHHIDVNRHDDRIHAFCVTREMPVLWASFAAWLELMAAMRGDDLLRVKGIVNIVERPGRPVVVHGLFHPPTLLEAWPSEDRRTRLVFIVRDLDREVIEDTLRVFSEVTPDQIAAAEARAAS